MHESETWRPVLAPEPAGRALEMAREVALRLARPGAAQEAVALARRQTAEPRSVYWLPQGLAQGDAGLALLFGQVEACFPGEGWDRLAHEALGRGTSAASQAGLGLFSGLPGLALAAGFLSRGGRRYQKLLLALEGELTCRAEAHLDSLPEGNLAAQDWDLVSGLVGLGLAAFTRNLPFLPRLLARLSSLGLSTGVGTGLFVPASRIANPSLRAEAPEGHLDLGLAHGLAGPLGLLGLARTSCPEEAWEPGPEGPARAEPAVERLVELLEACRADDAWGPNWPASAPARQGHLLPGPPTHAAWCYGAPGIARSLWHSGARDRALEAMRAVARRTLEARRLVAPGLCHGFAGLLVQALRFWHETGDPEMEALAREMAERLLGAFEPDSLLGFRSTEPGGRRVDHAGFLEGAPGVALALLAAATDREPGWDRVLLLS